MARKEYLTVISITSITSTGNLLEFIAPFSGTIKELHFKTTGSANSSGDNVFNIAKNGTNLYSSGARPKIAQNDVLGSKTNLSDAIVFGDILTVKADSLASGGVNANLILIIIFDDKPAGLPNIDWFGAWEARIQPEYDTEPVRKIIDISGNDHHLYQPYAAQAAVIADNQLNGYKVFDLTPNNGWYPVPPLVVDASFVDSELYMIPKTDNDPATGDTNQLHDLGVHNDGNFYPYTDGHLYMGFGVNARQDLGDPSTALNAWHCWNERVISAHYSAYINGGTSLISPVTLALSFSTNPTFFKRLSTGANTPFHGKCAAMYITRRGLTTGERTAFHSYLSGWTGLTIT